MDLVTMLTVAGTSVATVGLIYGFLRNFKTDINSTISRLETDMKENISRLETDMKEHISRLETDMKENISRLETDMKENISRLEKHIIRLEGEITTLSNKLDADSRALNLRIDMLFAATIKSSASAA